MQAGNLERLTEAGVISDAEALTDAERTVLTELEPEEVAMLVRMRKKLDDAIAKSGAESGGDLRAAGELQPSPSVIV